MSDINSINQTVVLTDRSDLVIDSVENIISFDETFLVIATGGGRLNIEGSELKVESLTKNDGKIHIVGKISGIFYSSETNKRGAFSKIFK